MIEGLRGEADLVKDNEITFEELAAYTRKKVKDYVTFELGQTQIPSTASGDSNIGSIVVSRLNSGAEKPEPGVSLAWNLTTGQRFDYVQTVKVAQEIKGSNGEQIENQAEMSMHLDWTVMDAHDGTYTIQQRIYRVEMVMNDPTAAVPTQLRYDSSYNYLESEDPWQAEIGKSIKPVLGGRFRTVMNSSGRVSEVQFSEALEKSLANIDASQPINGDMLRQLAIEPLMIAPTRRTTPGRSWTHSFDRPLPGIGSMTLDQTYQLKDLTKIRNSDVAKIKFVNEIDLDHVENSAGVQSMKINGYESEGEILFDLQRGFPLSCKFEQEFDMEMKVDNVDVTIKQSADSTITLTPRN